MKKFFKIFLIVVVVGFAGLLTLGAIVSSQQEEAAEQAGFDSVDEYKEAQKQNIATKAEYDEFVKRQAEIDARAAQDGGFLSIDEYKEARLVNMPTKDLYDKHLIQQAEAKLAEERRKIEESKPAQSEKANEGDKIAKAKEPERDTMENQNIAILKTGLDYPAMGTSYTDIKSQCDSEPSSSGNEEGHYSCSVSNDYRILVSKGMYVFGPDRNLKSRFFRFRNESGSDQFIDDKKILAVLDDKFGDRAITQTGKRRFRYQNQDTNFTAVSYGCKAYFIDKPGMDVPGGTPKTHQLIWVETGTVASLDDAERFDFEVIKNEVQNSSRCVVALVNYGGTNIPRGIDEKQDYKAEVHLLEVDAKFGLMKTKYW